jgi:pimeloyl-ACP methyl ester carboxylesterase
LTPATAVAVVLTPTDPPTGPRPVIAWTHGTTGALQKCMPSPASQPATAVPALDQAVAADWIERLCAFLPPEDPQRIKALVATFDGGALSPNAVLAIRLAQKAANYAIAAPVLIAQGLDDTVVPASATNAYVDERCAAGQRLEYWTFTGLGHGEIVQPDTPLDVPLIGWTAARLANEPQPGGCAPRSF